MVDFLSYTAPNEVGLGAGAGTMYIKQSAQPGTKQMLSLRPTCYHPNPHHFGQAREIAHGFG